ncbi:hypothetical protein [Pseudohongiella spirulinae]|uniref:Uncharacterized protein n=1 Tax=Pseudohongiella spirulinae TaxID=1249552 RepID=A0A0S2KAI5_9GAMM|nr:hypothetical protein [Pseudohongiella spirulinae]ALO44978.1 hypothetical protein PS2015_286 [Pseudohongiella spirulinae]
MSSNEDLDRQIAQMRREIQPERDLWQQIESRLPEQRQGAGFRWLGSAAAIAAVVTFAASGLLAWRLQLMPGWFEMQPASVRIVQQYEQQKAQQLGELGPVSEYFGNWRYQLAVWDQAIWQVQSAMDDNPDDPVLIGQMESLYRQQLGYIQTIASVDIYDY